MQNNEDANPTGNDAFFLTQGSGAYSRVRKAVIAATKEQTAQYTEITSHTQDLLTQARELKPQEVTGLYRTARRQLKQAILAAEGETKKVEKVMLIDLEYLRKCMEKEAMPPFEQIQVSLDN